MGLIYGYMDKMYGCLDIWTYEYMDKIYGYWDIWIYEYIYIILAFPVYQGNKVSQRFKVFHG